MMTQRPRHVVLASRAAGKPKRENFPIEDTPLLLIDVGADGMDRN